MSERLMDLLDINTNPHCFHLKGKPRMNSSDKVVQAGAIGTGDYATAIITQAEHIPNLNVSIVADTNIDAAHKAFQLAGIDESQIVVANSKAEALAGIQANKKVAVQDGSLLMDLPLDVIVEGTGSPTAGAVHAATALRSGKHVVMVTKETEVVLGTLLRRIAKENNAVYSCADGDQPSHLISLIEWCREIGLEVLCGGKFGEKRLWVDHVKQQLISRGGETQDLSAEEADLFKPLTGPDDQARREEAIARRIEILGKRAEIRTDDLTELGIVANATGLTIERDRLRHPVLWPSEMAATLCPKTYGGILEGRGIIEQTTYLRAANDVSMGGGVYVTVHTSNDYSRGILSGKGHMSNADGTSVMLFRPYHLCGVETPYSLLSAALKNTPSSGWNMEQRYDSYGRAKADLPAGTELHGAHDDKWETFLAPAVLLSSEATSDPIPYHIATGHKLTDDVSAGTVMTQDIVGGITDSPLWQMRAEQDA